MKQILFKCDENDYIEFKIYCFRKQITMADFLNKCIKEELHRNKEKEKENKEK